MRMKECRPVLVMIATFALCTSAFAADRVEVESRTIYAGKTATIGVYIENDQTVRAVVVPLVITQVSGSAYMNAWNPGFNTAARMDGRISELVLNDQYPTPDGTCRPALPHGFLTKAPMDFVSPDAQMFYRQSIFGQQLLPGTDFPVGSGEPSFTIELTVANFTGTFAIDTTCTDPGNHLYFVSGTEIIVPEFTRGIITVETCDCPDRGDMDSSGEINAADLAMYIDCVFLCGDNIPPGAPECPDPLWLPDLTCDGFPDSFDLAYLIDYVFFNGPPPCNPCDCSPYPTHCP